jgi:3-oxoadipate enol-lactonase
MSIMRSWLYVALTVSVATAGPAIAQGRTAKINGETLYYEVNGQGPALVLIHGWSLNLRMWDPQARALGRRFKVIRYDRRGFGKSTGSEDISWDAADLAALLDSIGVGGVHVLGMSQGGQIALQFVRDFPERATSLVLHSTSPPPGFPLPFTGPDRTRFDEWTKIAREQGMDAFRRTWSEHPLMRVPVGRADVTAKRDAILATYRGGRLLRPVEPSGPIKPANFDDFPKIEAPTLVIVGEKEVPFLQMTARVLSYYIPKARLEIVPGGGHMVNLIEPDRYNAAVLKFLDGVVVRRGKSQ